MPETVASSRVATSLRLQEGDGIERLAGRQRARRFDDTSRLTLRWTRQMAKGRDKRRRIAKRKEQQHVRAIDLRAIEKMSDEPPASLGDFDSLVPVPLKPKPHSRSGAIALPEPPELEEDGALEYLKIYGL